MKCEVFFELRETEKSLERRLAHVQDVAEAHVIFYQGEDLLGVFVGETEAREDRLRDAYADFDVTVKTDTVAGLIGIGRAEGSRFADVMEQRSPCECRGKLLREVFRAGA